MALKNTTRWSISEPSRRESESVNGVEEHHSLGDFEGGIVCEGEAIVRVEICGKLVGRQRA
jgi:hypothetical protein